MKSKRGDCMLIGHASIDENKKAKGGKAGDQTGKEVCTRSWYSKPWDVLLRCKDATKAELMAQACEKACANNHIGYDQYQRNTLRIQALSKDWDLSKITVDCETDCSAFMTVCAECAGIPFSYTNAPTTRTMRKEFQKTGYFDVLTDSKYLNSDKYLKRGDILVKEGSHTVMVLGNSSSITSPTLAETVATGKSIDQLAQECIKGYWMSGTTRKMLLEGAGYDYAAVQARVNEILKVR